MNNKTKKDPSKSELGSSQVKGQGTTNIETGNVEASSSRKKQKQS
ncbi:YuzL family protein [Peribacillus psychrosaccharolyticus]|uniref:YuzL family protein n=1 Tax=Peribacillus psychrosaccharolyticus TaxID=1407 RepID=A0A974S0E8_PERPY|nr:YuzL family protein [Peribacillus psychrosaccharolyticus]MEC2056444.1 YuzL family protein [Peribacillus psychrosaccharolyticus]MED3745420.1 YuzL family protein [Peribacillus psychrosaccharolyticus]QQT00401.1 YuzL family protein [Peribacillus psychrosaccharolyticus]